MRRFWMLLLLSHLTLFCGFAVGAAQAQSVGKDGISVKQFGATGNGVTDDTKAIQKAIDATPAGQTVRFPPGVYLVTSVGLKAGLRYVGQQATIKRFPHQGKWIRTFTTDKPGYTYSGDTDSPLLTIEGLSFDGNRDKQGPYSKYELEQAHLIFLSADPSRKGRLRALVRNCHFRESVADGISLYTNVEAQILDCTSFNCFRGGFVLTGGYTRARVKNFASSGTILSKGIDIEVDGKGYGDTLQVSVVMEHLRLSDGHFDIAVSDGSDVTVSDVISRSGFYLSALGAKVLVQNADLGVGLLSDYWNRIVFPGHTTFKNCQFTLRPEIAPQEGEVGKWAAIHVFWNISGTAYQDQVLEFIHCAFKVAKEVSPQDTTYAFLLGRYAPVDDRNTLNLKYCTIARQYDYGVYSTSAARMNIQNTRVDAAIPFTLDH